MRVRENKKKLHKTESLNLGRMYKQENDFISRVALLCDVCYL